MRRLIIQVHAALFGAGLATALLGHPSTGTVVVMAAILVGALEGRIAKDSPQ